jgi:hypothetical protein
LFGDFKAAPDIRACGPAAGGGYVLRAGAKVKVAGTGRLNWPEFNKSPQRGGSFETAADQWNL